MSTPSVQTPTREEETGRGDFIKCVNAEPRLADRADCPLVEGRLYTIRDVVRQTRNGVEGVGYLVQEAAWPEGRWMAFRHDRFAIVYLRDETLIQRLLEPARQAVREYELARLVSVPA